MFPHQVLTLNCFKKFILQVYTIHQGVCCFLKKSQKYWFFKYKNQLCGPKVRAVLISIQSVPSKKRKNQSSIYSCCSLKSIPYLSKKEMAYASNTNLSNSEVRREPHQASAAIDDVKEHTLGIQSFFLEDGFLNAFRGLQFDEKICQPFFHDHAMMCKICHSTLTNILLLPCGHFQSCENCFNSAPVFNISCLTCGKPSQGFVKAILPMKQ
jgi:hypothetical protein